MSKNKRILMTLLTIFVAVLCSFLAIENPDFLSKVGTVVTPGPPDPLEVELNNLASRYENGEISVIDISTITTFSWDRFYIFGDYTQPSDLDTVFGWSWHDKCSDEVSYISSSDSYTLLVFSNNGTVAHCLAYRKAPYYLLVPHPNNKSGYSPQEALFVLSASGRMVLKDNK